MGRFRWIVERIDDDDPDPDDHLGDGHSGDDDDDHDVDVDGDGTGGNVVEAPLEWEFVPSDEREATALTVRRRRRGPQLGDDANVGSPPRRTRRSGVHPRFPPFLVLVPTDSSSDVSSLLRDLPGGEERRKRKRRGRSRLVTALGCATCVVAVLFASWLQREGPPGPPPSGSLQLPHQDGGPPAWNDYLSHHFHQLWESATALAYHTPSHLLKWWMVSVRLDVEGWQNAIQSKWSMGPDVTKQCVLSVPTDLSKRLRRGSNRTRSIVGQAVAAQAVADAFASWSTRMSHDMSARGPLILLFSGMGGTGKKTMARAVARLVSNCTVVTSGAAPTTPSTANPAVALLTGGHYRSTATNYETPSPALLKLQLLHDLQRSVRSATGPPSTSGPPLSFVIVENVEDMDPRVLNGMLTELSAIGEADETGPDVSDAELTSSSSLLPTSLLGELARTVLFLTSSNVGTKTIFSWLRHYGLQPHGIEECEGGCDEIDSDSPPQRLPPGFFLDMEHEVNEAFGALTYRTLSAIVPFVPHTRESLSRVFREELQSYLKRNIPSFGECEVAVGSALVDSVLDRHLEFVSWRTRTSADEHEEPVRAVLTFSSSGASSVPRLVREFVTTVLSTCRFSTANDGTTAVFDMVPSEILDVEVALPTFVLKLCRSLASPEACSSECFFHY